MKCAICSFLDQNGWINWTGILNYDLGFMNYQVFNFFFCVDHGKAGSDAFLFNLWTYDDVQVILINLFVAMSQVLVVIWRRIEVHNVWYFGNNYISSITVCM
ncbi:hypothetical protein Hanom_Chr15g01366991 [Helianthus anomalus]